MSGLLYLNGLDAEDDLEFGITGLGGLLGAPARTLGLVDVPGIPGAIDSGITPREGTRLLTIGGLIMSANETAIAAVLDRITEVCGTGLVEIRGPFSTGRAYYGVLQTLPGGMHQPTILDGWAQFTLTFVCPMPYAVTLTPETISFGATPVDIPHGTAPSAGRDQWSALIEIVGSATTPTLTYLNARGGTVRTMIFTTSPAAGDSLLIDCGRRRVQRRVSGAWSSAMNYLTAGYRFPDLDPGDGYVSGALYPKLKVSSGTGIIRYYRMWR